MRTYTRRRQAHQLIENVHELCRLCLQQTKGTSTVSLFENESVYLCPSLTMKIMMLLGFEITNEDCLPNSICIDCFEKLDKYYTFRKKCAVTYQTLKSHTLAAQEVLVNKVTTSNNLANGFNYANKERLTLTIDEDQQLTILSSKQHETTHTDNSWLVTKEDDSNFLTTILLEMGILKKQSDGFLQTELNNHVIELETGDGHQLTLQLFESDESQHSVAENCNSKLQNSTSKQEKSKNERPTCEVCGRRFATSGVLRRHARVHTGERPYACRSCPLRFAQRAVLLRHQLVHQEHRPYACRSCPKSFTQRSGLEAHARSHAPPGARAIALHSCTLCPKMFQHPSGLSRHIKHHDGQTTACTTCSGKFRDRSSLLRHQRTAHALPDSSAPEGDGYTSDEQSPSHTTSQDPSTLHVESIA